MKWGVLLVAAWVLAGCSGSVFSNCPPVIEYSREFQKRAADELEARPQDRAIMKLVEDYYATREQLRTCQ